MRFFAFNLALAVIWMLMSGDVSLRNLMVGLGVGFVVVAFHQRLLGSRSYFDSLVALVTLAALLLKQLWLASWQLTFDIMRRRPNFNPVIVKYDMSHLRPAEIAILSNLIGLTPGSLAVDANVEDGTMLVHSLYGSDVEEVRAGIEVYVRLLRDIQGPADEGDAS